jgi:hypothetical protein
MVDVSRHYIPIPQLLKTVDGMSLSRFNILHMHLTDSQVRTYLSTHISVQQNYLCYVRYIGISSTIQRYTKV